MIGIMVSPDDGRVIEANGISLYVEGHGDGVPVLLLHGWPDSARLWRHQVPVLTASGYRVITPSCTTSWSTTFSVVASCAVRPARASTPTAIASANTSQVSSV